MTRRLFIVLFSVLFFSACGVSSSAPLDDTYYWPDEQTVQAPNDTLP